MSAVQAEVAQLREQRQGAGAGALAATSAVAAGAGAASAAAAANGTGAAVGAVGSAEPAGHEADLMQAASPVSACNMCIMDQISRKLLGMRGSCCQPSGFAEIAILYCRLSAS